MNWSALIKAVAFVVLCYAAFLLGYYGRPWMVWPVIGVATVVIVYQLYRLNCIFDEGRRGRISKK